LLESVQEQLRAGAEAGQLLNRAAASIVVAQMALDTLSRLRALPGASVIFSEVDEGIAVANQVRGKMTAVVAVAGAPEPPPVPEDILTAAEAGPFTRLDDLRQRRQK
jgi:hypothetical protein